MLVSAAAGQPLSAPPALQVHGRAGSAVLLLVATGLFGTTINGARLWFRVAGQTVQTTELIKLFLVVFIAGYLADMGGVLAAPRLRFAGRTYSALPYAIPLVLTLLTAMAMIALLRDLGQIVLLDHARDGDGLRRHRTPRLRASAASSFSVFRSPSATSPSTTPVRGIDVWLDPYSDSAGAGYQTLQSIYAIQAGGVTGEGLGLGDPEAIPIVSTDYIFSAIAEELGLAGALGVVLLYLLLLFAGFRVALSARDDFGRLLAACIALLLAIQAGVIIGGNLRLIPTTGITLPFVSYGGSSLIVNFMLVGLLLGISNRAGRASGLKANDDDADSNLLAATQHDTVPVDRPAVHRRPVRAA